MQRVHPECKRRWTMRWTIHAVQTGLQREPSKESINAGIPAPDVNCEAPGALVRLRYGVKLFIRHAIRQRLTMRSRRWRNTQFARRLFAMWIVNQASEQCDDGNNTNGDHCSATCQIESWCGDGSITNPASNVMT